MDKSISERIPVHPKPWDGWFWPIFRLTLLADRILGMRLAFGQRIPVCVRASSG